LNNKFNEKNKLTGGDPSRPLTKQEQEELSKRIDDRNTMELFDGFIKEDAEMSLKSEKAYTDYAKRVGEILMKEDRKKHIQEFVKELLNVVYPKFTSLEYQEIHTKATFLFNQKQKEEKSVDTKKKKTGKQPSVNASKATTAKLTGFEDLESDDDEQYSTKKADNLDDFM